MKNDVHLIDNSSDRKYFTIVPNYILNHSTATEQALYLQMKRLAGENGLCFMTQKNLCKKLGIGRDKLRASLEYLAEHKWIEFVGTTESKTKPINTYRINDIWKLNMEHYQEKKISSESALSFNTKDKTQKTIDKIQNSPKIRSKTVPIRRTHIKEEPIKKNKRKKYSSLKDIKDSDLLEISDKYQVKISFVRLQFEKLTNYCEAKGKRYKNYKSALRNFVLGNMTTLPTKKKEVKPQEPDNFVPIDPKEFEAIKKQAYKIIGGVKPLAQQP